MDGAGSNDVATTNSTHVALTLEITSVAIRVHTPAARLASAGSRKGLLVALFFALNHRGHNTFPCATPVVQNDE